MKRVLLPFTVLLAALAVGCATPGSLGALRASHNQAEATRVKAETEAAAAAQRQAQAEQRKVEAGRALAGGLVKAASDDVAAAEAAAARAKAKREEACGLNPDLPECKSEPLPAAPTPPNPPALPKADPAPAPAPPLPPAPAPEAEPEAAEEEPEVREAELPHVHIRLTVINGKTELSFTEALPEGWEVKWQGRGVLALSTTINGERVEKYTVKTARLGEGCWRLFESGTVTKEECPAQGN